ncbi:uncharacterized protein LOC129770441 isoform X4 [Toxorhynchites rutilus septentrionalis]|nr:uncharacterized protein LOC129770441 isoform X4 [Toxorhynchites rutilus septentrionalis]
MLKHANVLGATEYVLRLCSREDVQKVMNDLLEAEHVLLAELISYSCIDTDISTTMRDILRESFDSILDDFLETPNVISCNYLKNVEPFLTKTEMKQLRKQHMLLLLQKDCSSRIEQAITLQELWRSDAAALSGSIFGQIILESVRDVGETVEQLFEASYSMKHSWEYFLVLLNAVIKSFENDKIEILRVKELMRKMHSHVLSSNDFGQFLVMFLIAREVCAANEHVFGKYSNWYKSTIGEMSYTVSEEQFKQMMEKMTMLIQLEKSVDIVKTHISIAISPPPKCMSLVVNFKQLCRGHLAALEGQNTSSHGTSSVIVID